jgi:hypothetical protein
MKFIFTAIIVLSTMSANAQSNATFNPQGSESDKVKIIEAGRMNNTKISNIRFDKLNQISSLDSLLQAVTDYASNALLGKYFKQTLHRYGFAANIDGVEKMCGILIKDFDDGRSDIQMGCGNPGFAGVFKKHIYLTAS